jgi:hypothetical protein
MSDHDPRSVQPVSWTPAEYAYDVVCPGFDSPGMGDVYQERASVMRLFPIPVPHECCEPAMF